MATEDDWDLVTSASEPPDGLDLSTDGPAFRALSSVRQQFIAMWVLESDVLNGGFLQFYFNGWGWLAELAAAGYEAIGAKDCASLVRQLQVIADRECQQLAETPEALPKVDTVLEAFAWLRTRTSLNDFDDLWYELDDRLDLTALKAAYWRDHPEEFGHGEP